MRYQPESHWARRMLVVAPCKREGLVEKVLDSEAVLYDESNGHTHRMNETALWVWRACDGRSTTWQLAERLTRAFEVSHEAAQSDVEQLIAAFAQAGLVTASQE